MRFMKPHGYIIRRLILLIPILIGVSVITFILTHLTGDPIAAWVTPKTPLSMYPLIRQQHHLNDPIIVQYIYYVNDLLHFNLGLSASEGGRPVASALADYFPATAELTIAAMILILLIGIPIGIISAIRKDCIEDHIVRIFSLCGVSIPVFWFALILQYIFYLKLGWLPLGGRLPVTMMPPHRVTGFYTMDSLLAGQYDTFAQAVIHLILPAFCLAFSSLAVISRLIRSSMLEAMAQDFIQTARAKGLSERVVILKHALRNALIPTTTMSGLAFAGLLSGAVLIETIFMWPGIGRYSTKAITSNDFASIMGFTLLVVIVFVLVNLVVDILYAYIDPRVKHR
jgi:ABC-type dipeptide/oligopeptide/nickel transport system permease component